VGGLKRDDDLVLCRRRKRHAAMRAVQDDRVILRPLKLDELLRLIFLAK
jgi:hypothetical protein